MREIEVIASTVQLGEMLALAREIKGCTLRELERQTGVSNALISQIETGKIKDPGFSIVVRLARGLGISVERCAKPYNDWLDNKHAGLRKHLADTKEDLT